jgi:transposase
MQVTTVGLDLAKHWFQVHGIDADGRIVVRRRLQRSGVIVFFRSLEPCVVGAWKPARRRTIGRVN